MSRAKVQIYVVIGVLVLWAVGIIIAVKDGNEMVKITTPAATLVLGWLFASKATE